MNEKALAPSIIVVKRGKHVCKFAIDRENVYINFYIKKNK